MNKIFKRIWSRERNQTVVVSESQTTHTSGQKRVQRLFSGALFPLSVIAAALLPASVFATGAVTEDVSSWTAPAENTVTIVNEDRVISGTAFGRTRDYAGWDNESSGINKITVESGASLIGGVYGVQKLPNPEGTLVEENTGKEGETGLLRYHTMVVNGTFKDSETYRDVASGQEKPQVGSLNWLNRLAVGNTGKVSVKEVRIADTFVNQGAFSADTLLVKDGAKIQNDGTITVSKRVVLGTKADVFDNGDAVDASEVNMTPGTSAAFVNGGTVTIEGELLNYAEISDTDTAGTWKIKHLENHADKSVSSKGFIAKTIEVEGKLENYGHLEVASLNTESGVDNYGTLTADRANLAGLTNANTVEVKETLVVTNHLTYNHGNLTALNVHLGETLNEGAFCVTGNENSEIGSLKNGATVNLSGNTVVASLEQTKADATLKSGQTLEIAGTVSNKGSITVDKKFSVGGTTTNFKDITADCVNLKDVTNTGELKTTGSDASSIGALTNSGKAEFADAVTMGSLENQNQTSSVIAKKNLTVKGEPDNSGTAPEEKRVVKNYGTLTVTNLFTSEVEVDNYETGTINAGSANLAALSNAKDVLITGKLTVNGQTLNYGSLSASAVKLGDVLNEAEIKVTGNDSSEIGITSNGGSISLSGDTSFARLSQTNIGSVTSTKAVNVTGALVNAGSVTATSLAFSGGSSSNSGTITATSGVTTGANFVNTGTLSAGRAFTVTGGVSTLNGTVAADNLVIQAGGKAQNESATNAFKTLTAQAGSSLVNDVDMRLDTIAAGTGVSYTQNAGSLTVADNSFFKDSTLTIKGGSLNRTASGADTLGSGNTLILSGNTAASYPNGNQLGPDWKSGQTVVSVGLLNSDSTVNLKSGGILEAKQVALTTKTLHFDGGALSVQLGNVFEGVSETVYKITDGSETHLETNVLGVADVSGLKDAFKNNIDFTENGGTVVLTDQAVSLRAVTAASTALKTLAGTSADKVNVVFTGVASGSQGASTDFYHDTYTELASEQSETSAFKNPGVVFASMSYQNKVNSTDTAYRSKLVVGTAQEQEDAFVLADSIGFAKIVGTDDVLVNAGKTLSLIGGTGTDAQTNLLNSADGRLKVTGTGSQFVFGSKGVASSEGVLGTLTASDQGAVRVAMGKYKVANLSLNAATGTTDEGTTLNVTNLTTDLNSSIVNAGTMRVESAEHINATVENKGNLAVGSATQIGNTFLNTAGSALFEGTVEITKSFVNKVDALVKTAGMKISEALDASATDKIVMNEGKFISTGDNTVNGALIVKKTGKFVATEKTDLSSNHGRIDVFGDAAFETVNVTKGYLTASDGALLHADTIHIGALGTLYLKGGSTVVAKKLVSDGSVAIERDTNNVTWILGELASDQWDEDNKTRIDALMDGVTSTRTSAGLRAAFRSPRGGLSESFLSNVDFSEIQTPEEGSLIVKSNNQQYVVNFDRTKVGHSMLSEDLGAANNMLSAPSGNNYTYRIGSTSESGQRVLDGGSVKLMDSAYVVEGDRFTISEGGSVIIEDVDKRSQPGGKNHPGMLVVSGTVTISGTLTSEQSAGVALYGDGKLTVTSSGKDIGSTLSITGNATYAITGGQAHYDDLNIKSGTLQIQSGYFGNRLTKEAAAYTSKAAVFGVSCEEIETGNGIIIVGTVDGEDAVTNGSVYFGSDSALVLNASSLTSSALFKGNNTGSFTVKNESDLVVDHATWGKHYILAGGYDTVNMSNQAWNGEHLINRADETLSMAVTKADGKVILSVGASPNPNPDPTPTPNPDPTPTPDTSIQALSPNFSVPEVINGLIDSDVNSALRDPNSAATDIRFLERVLDKTYVGTTASGALDTDKAVRVWNSAVELSAASGMDAYALGQVADVLDSTQETLAAGQHNPSSNLWVKTIGKYSYADKLESTGAMKGGYSATSYGVELGADLLKTDTFRAGVALHYAKGNLKSEGMYTKTDTDAQVYGGLMYAAYQAGDAVLSAQVGYASARGKAKQHYGDVLGNAYRIEGDVDTDFVSADIRGGYALQVSEATTLTPHVGLRYIRGNHKSYKITINGSTAWNVDSHSENIWQIPFGVTLQADLRHGEWVVNPYADLSVVRTFGDTQAQARVSATGYSASDSYAYDVTGKTSGVVRLGLNADTGNHSIGLSYMGSFGTQGTRKHSLTASYLYRF